MTRKITAYVHPFIYSKPSRDFHLLFLDIIEQLKLHSDDLNIIVNDRINVADFNDMILFDCEILVEYDGMFKGVCLADYCSQLSLFFSSGIKDKKIPRKENDILLIPQGKSPNNIWTDEYISKVKCKILGGIYTPHDPNVNFDSIRQNRKNKILIDKFVFKGNVYALPRNVVPYLTKSEYYSGMDTYAMLNYLENVSEHKVGLCIPGAGEICHRDIEYMAIGIPMMKFEYMSNLTPPLIPNFHYISIPRIDTHPFLGERNGGEDCQLYANLYIQKFLEVKDDIEFLNFISKNAMEYYDRYLHPSTRVKHIFNLWELPFYNER